MFREITITSKDRTEFIDITSKVDEAIRRFDLTEGSILVYVPHTTAGVTINENADPSVVSDISTCLEKLVPWRGPYTHGEGNAAAHVKASLMGSSVIVPVHNGRSCLGTWQGIFFTEFDGPRTRKVCLQGHIQPST